jgi:hypothetical protein
MWISFSFCNRNTQNIKIFENWIEDLIGVCCQRLWVKIAAVRGMVVARLHGHEEACDRVALVAGLQVNTGTHRFYFILNKNIMFHCQWMCNTKT